MTAPVPVRTLLGAPPGNLAALGPGRVALAGLYFDHSAEGRPGARFAARQLRYESPPAGPAPPALVDLGDLNVFPLEPARHAAVLAEQTSRILATGSRLLVVGGDHGGALGLLDGLLAMPGAGRVGVLRLSARLDLDPGHAGARRGVNLDLADLLAGGVADIAFVGLAGRVPVEEVARAGAALRLPARMPVAAAAAALRDWARSYDRLFLSLDRDCANPVAAVLAGLEGLSISLAHLSGHVPDLDITGAAATRQVVTRAALLADLLAGDGRWN